MVEKLVRVKESHAGEAGRTLAMAFRNYPVFVYIFPDPAERTTSLPVFFESMVRYGVHHGEVYATSPAFEGVAVWLPPGFPGGFDIPPDVSQGALNRNNYWCSQCWQVRKSHVKINHWYLELLGVSPEFQGKGLGGLLLSPMLDRIEQENLPCYLDTELTKNVPLYQHFGFRVVEETDVPDTGVHSWGMLKDAPG